jgi:hypothetical protein
MKHRDLDGIKALLTPPARRLVNEMKLQISEINLGDCVGATFVSPVFGVYTLSGNVTRASHGDLVLSVYSIETKGSPPNDVVRLDTSGQSIAATGPPGAALSLEHGSIVRATFTDRDSFINVVGPAVVATRAPMMGVGGWILAHNSRPGVHLKALDILAAPGELEVKCPPPTASWHDA